MLSAELTLKPQDSFDYKEQITQSEAYLAEG